MANKEAITFLLNDKVKQLTNIDPNTSVLNYLRDDLNRCGTKEGCASGDCGACTVVLGELIGDQIHYKSINACISFLPCLHGKQLITVEDLKQGQALHPVQQAMVDCHGSQCGFCTPGFVMSLYALHKNHPHPNREEIFAALGGNLCRCTGYRPIIDAAARTALTDGQTAADKTAVKQLSAIQKNTMTLLSHGSQRYYAPTSIDELTALLQQYPQARLLAGGTDLALEVTQQHKRLDTIIYLGGIAELCAVVTAKNSITIGAMATYSQCFTLLAQEYPDLGEMLERLGSLQIRNLGTIGGNIGNASPIGDMPPVLIALGADLKLCLADNTRRIKVEDFFLDYKITALREAEFIQHIEIPRAKPGYQLKIYKISKRFDDDISAVLGVFHLNIEHGTVVDVSIAYGGMAAIPKRARHCEDALRNQPWTENTVLSAAMALERDFTPLTDVRASAQYRMQVAKNLLRKCFVEISSPATITRVSQYA